MNAEKAKQMTRAMKALVQKDPRPKGIPRAKEIAMCGVEIRRPWVKSGNLGSVVCSWNYIYINFSSAFMCEAAFNNAENLITFFTFVPSNFGKAGFTIPRVI